MNACDNEHVHVHELRGFMANDLLGAFREAEAISSGTKCKQYLFSLSLSPPPDADVPIAAFEAAIEEIEGKLGLTGQPRAVVFHEKKARRHAHCVWSRIDPETMRAINLPHFKRRLHAVARELYRTHGWDMPAGFTDAAQRDLNAYEQVEAAQAEKARRDPSELKAFFRECWERSDSAAALSAALTEGGFALARGSRRAFVAVDASGKVYSLSRWAGAGAKALRARLGTPDGLPSVEEAAASLAGRSIVGTPPPHLSLPPDIAEKLTALIERQRAERQAQEDAHRSRIRTEHAERRARLPRGLRKAWSRMTGRYEALTRALEAEAAESVARDRAERDALIAQHLAERRTLAAELDWDVAFARLGNELTDKSDRQVLHRDPRQVLILPPRDMPPSRDEVDDRPEAVLDHLSDKRETFTVADIRRVLESISDDAVWRDHVLGCLRLSDKLVPLSADTGERFTTRQLLDAQEGLRRTAGELAASTGFRVGDRNVRRSIAMQNDMLGRNGASLSDEQVASIEHLLSGERLSLLVGYAGAGKSTLLSAARAAWEAQGYAVFGTALSGKAADGLEEASGIRSRTLALLETSWKNGHDPIPVESVIVLDEAGMVGTRQLQRVADELSQRGCKLVLIGDPEQLQPIQAGTPFRDLLDRMPHAKLTEVRRQTEEWQRAASIDLAQGNIEMALRYYADRGLISEAQTKDEAIAALVADYTAGASDADYTGKLALAHRRRDVFALNQGIRAARLQAGELVGETLVETHHGPRAFAPGDRMLFTRNDATLWVRNGLLGTVEVVDGTELRVRLDGSNLAINFNTRYYNAVDHGYAVSIHKAQGCTVDQTFVLGSQTMDRHLAYVAMTRHRSSGRLFTAVDDQPSALHKQALAPARHEVQRRPGPRFY